MPELRLETRMEGAAAGNLLAAPPPIAVPPLHPFLEHPGEPVEAWTHWLTKFENHCAMVTLGRAGAYTPQEKSRYLLLLLGTEGQCLVRHLPAIAAIDTLRHDEFITTLKTILVLRSSPFRALVALMGRRQRMGEAVHQYVADHRDLASHCPLPPGSRRLLGGQHPRHRLRLRQGPVVALHPARSGPGTGDRSPPVGRSSEDGHGHGTEDGRRCSGAEWALGRGQVQARRWSTKGGAARGAKTPASSSSSSCGNCGGPHRSGHESCPAKEKTCHKCKKKGHLEAYCKSGWMQKVTAGAVFLSSSQDKETMEQVQALGGTSPRIKSTVKMWTGREWAPVELEVDTGTSVSMLRRSDLNALQVYLPLNPLARPLLNYDQHSPPGGAGYNCHHSPVWGKKSRRGAAHRIGLLQFHPGPRLPQAPADGGGLRGRTSSAAGLVKGISSTRETCIQGSLVGR